MATSRKTVRLEANTGVDVGDVDVLSVVPGTEATSLGKAEDAAHASGDVGVMSLAVRKDTAAALAGTDGDYAPLEVDADGRLHTAAVGNIASGAADSGNPVKVGGKYNTTLPILTNGQRGDAQLDDRSNLRVRAIGATSAGGDGVTNVHSWFTAHTGDVAQALATVKYVFNGSTWDRARNNLNETILASAARTATVDSADFTNYNGRGLHVVVDMTTYGGAGSITVTIQGKDALSGKYYTILASAAITAVGTTVLKVYPGIATIPNGAASDILPRTWRVSVAVGDATSHTYSIGASGIV